VEQQFESEESFPSREKTHFVLSSTYNNVMEQLRKELELVFDFDKVHEATKAKTELCRAVLRPFRMCGFHNCHFAHSIQQLKPKVHNKLFFKATKCMKFISGCKYSVRCSYVHDEKSYTITPTTKLLFSQAERVFRIVHDQGNKTVAVYTLETDGNYQEQMSQDLIESLWAFVKRKHREIASVRGCTPGPQALQERNMSITTMSREGTPCPLVGGIPLRESSPTCTFAGIPSREGTPRLQTVPETNTNILQSVVRNNTDLGSERSESKCKQKRDQIALLAEVKFGPYDFATPEKSAFEIPTYTYSSRSSTPETDYWSSQCVEPFLVERPEDKVLRLQDRIESLQQENKHLRTRLSETLLGETKGSFV